MKDNYPEEIKKAFDQAQQYRLRDPQKTLQSILVLRKYAQEKNDGWVMAHADFFQANVCYLTGDFDAARYFVNQACAYFNEAKDYRSVGVCRNMYGLTSVKKGDFAEALNCFFDVVHISDAHHLISLKTFGLLNLADICIQFENWHNALDYFIASEKNMDLCTDDPQYPSFYLAAAVQGMICAGRIGDNDNLHSQLSKARSILSHCPEAQEGMEVAVFHAYEAMLNSDEDALRNACVSFNQVCADEVERLSYTTEIIEILHITREHHFDDLFEEIVSILEENHFAEHEISLAYQLSRQKISYLKEKGDEEALNQELRHAMQYFDRFYDCTNPMMIALFDTQAKLYSSQNVNAQLVSIAHTDDLTGLGNRRRFNEEADRIFAQASRRNCSMSVEILDIDNFKSINDTYGHLAGDHVLIGLARVLHQLKSENVIPVRYGGDEFVIITLDKSDEELAEMAQSITSSIAKGFPDLNIPSFTVSQGIVNHKVREDNQIWDYTSVADDALYASKRKGKNSITLVHHKMELKNS